MATYWENSCSFGLRYVSWYKYLIVSLVFSHLGFWSGNLFLIAPFPDLCLLVPFFQRKFSVEKCRRENAVKVTGKNDTLKSSVTDSNMPTGCWEQMKVALSYQHRISSGRKTESVKLKESAESARSSTVSSKLTYSTCNRQFRANIGLVSH